MNIEIAVLLNFAISLSITFCSIYCYHLIVQNKRSQAKLKSKNAQHLYEPLSDIEDQINKSQAQVQFNHLGNISTDDYDGINLQQFTAKMNEERKSHEKQVGELDDQIKLLSQHLQELEQNQIQQNQALSNEQKKMGQQIVELSNQFSQLRIFFEGKITEQIQIYSQTSQKLEQLDDLSQHFQTQISLVKQEQTKELIALNEKIDDVNSNTQKSLLSLQDQFSTIHEVQQHESEHLKQQLQSTQSPQPSQNENNGLGKPGLTRQVQEIGQLKKQPTYKKSTKQADK